MKLKDMGEFGFIRSIMDDCHFGKERLIKGIGDDCAVLGPYEGNALLVTTDLLVEDVHFLLSKTPPDHLGRKAVAVNLSDIAAMGGEARHLFVSIAIPPAVNVETLHDIYGGIKAMCSRYRVNLLGGDTSASPERLMINITVLGEMPEDEVLYRSGARPGDVVFVTGTLGDSLAGLKIIQEEWQVSEPFRSELIHAHHLPVPFLEPGRLAARSHLASAMIDLSDGLMADLGHICEQSGVGAEIHANRLPISEALKASSKANALVPHEAALSGGEDYRLLITVPPQNKTPFQDMFSDGKPCPLYPIGEMRESGGIRIMGENGREITPAAVGFDHFKRR
ncbi:MAG: thiamine-phosphate kinase [Deltaproteobacteria bacterium]|nr:thiamine-phosphate kinase [Deltaproteobacteria bacterium]